MVVKVESLEAMHSRPSEQVGQSRRHHMRSLQEDEMVKTATVLRFREEIHMNR